MLKQCVLQMRLPGNLNKFFDLLRQGVLTGARVNRLFGLNHRSNVTVGRNRIGGLGLNGWPHIKLLLGNELLQVHQRNGEDA